MRRTVIALGVGVALSMTASVRPAKGADPDPKKVCIDADTQGQSLRRAGKLEAARAALKACLDARCPVLVRTDCNERMDELARVQPTVVVEAKDGRGADLSAVKVFVDGTQVADSLGGEALSIDPGPHDLRFETAGAEPVTHHLILREGDHGRREAVVFGGGAQPAATTPVTTTTTATGATESDDTGRGRRVAGIAVGAGGLLLLVPGVIFGVIAKGQWDSADDKCHAGYCPGSSRSTALDERSHALTFGTLSTVGYIAGGVLVAGGVTLYLTAPQKTESAATAARLGISPTAGGAVLHGTF
jgi:hypothetical protein